MHLTSSEPQNGSHQGLIASWASLLEAYGCLRLVDIARLTACALSERGLQRAAEQFVQAGTASRALHLGHHHVLVKRTPGSRTPSAQTLSWGLQRAMLDGGLTEDGFRVSHGDPGRRAVKAWLMQHEPPAGTEPMLARSAKRAIEDLPETGPDTPYTVAWRGPSRRPEDLRLAVVMHPNVSQRRQLEDLPLTIAGQPRIQVIVRPADDGTTVDRVTGETTYRGRQYRCLMRAFREHRNPGAFPLWETATVVKYRPDLWVRTTRRE